MQVGSCLAQKVISQVYLKNGEVASGRMIAIGDAYVLLEATDGLETISRDDIWYISNESTTSLSMVENRFTLKPISKRYCTEIDAGLTFINPFALRTGIIQWRNFGSKWQLGLGTSLQFYRFTMVNVNANTRRFLGSNQFIRPFWETGFGLSIYEYVSNVNFRSSFGFLDRPNQYVSDFSPVKQAQTGLGIWMDTGVGVAFAGKMLYNLTWYNLTEHIGINYALKGEYLVSSVTLQASFIF